MLLCAPLESEASFVDLERPDLRFKCGSRDAELRRSAVRPEHASAAGAQGFFDEGLFVARHFSRQCEWAIRSGTSQEPVLGDDKLFSLAHDQGPLDHIL